MLIELSEFGVEAESGDGDGAARLVIAGIVDVLKIKGCEEAAPEVRSVEALEDLFRAVSEAAVAEQEAESAEGKILLVRGHDSVFNESDAGAIVAPMP